MFVAPSWDGLLLGIAALSAFLIHQPFKQWWSDVRVKRKIPRTAVARNFMIGYTVTALLAFGVVLLRNRGTLDFAFPFVMAFPFVAIQQMYDAKGRSRALGAELCGALALSATAPAISVLGGFALEDAMLVWLLVVVWVITSIFYVRTRLRLEKGRLDDYDIQYVGMLHGLGLLIVGVGWYNQALPLLALIAMAFLAIRAAWGLSPYRRPVKAIQIGIGEVFVGLTYTLLCAVGYAW